MRKKILNFPIIFTLICVVTGIGVFLYNKQKRLVNLLIKEKKEAVYATYDFYLDPSRENKKRMIREKGDVQLIDYKIEELDFNDLEKTIKFFYKKGYVFKKHSIIEKESCFLGKILEEGEIAPPIIGKKHIFKYVIFEEKIIYLSEYGPKGRRALGWLSQDDTIYLNHTLCYRGLKWIWGIENALRKNNELIESGDKEADPIRQLNYVAYNPYFEQARRSRPYKAKKIFLKSAYRDEKERIFIHEAAHKNFGPYEYYPRLSELIFSPSHSTISSLINLEGYEEKMILKDFVVISGVPEDELYTLTTNQLSNYARKLMEIKVENDKKNYPSFKGIKIGDPIEKAIKILGEPTDIHKYPEKKPLGSDVYYRYQSNGIKYEFRTLHIGTLEGKINKIFIIYLPSAPYNESNLMKMGYIPDQDNSDDGSRIWRRSYFHKDFNVLETYGWHKGTKGPVSTRIIKRLD